MSVGGGEGEGGGCGERCMVIGRGERGEKGQQVTGEWERDERRVSRRCALGLKQRPPSGLQLLGPPPPIIFLACSGCWCTWMLAVAQIYWQ